MKTSPILWYYGLLQEKGKRIPEVFKKKARTKMKIVQIVKKGKKNPKENR